MKIKSTKTTIEYAGWMVILPSGAFDGEAISDTLDTTANAIELVNAPYKKMEHYYNISASRSYSVVHDFDSVEDALAYKVAAEDHATANPVGDLTIKIGDTVRTYEAALTQVGASVSLSPSSVRLILRWEFTTGTPKNEDV